MLTKRVAQLLLVPVAGALCIHCVTGDSPSADAGDGDETIDAGTIDQEGDGGDQHADAGDAPDAGLTTSDAGHIMGGDAGSVPLVDAGTSSDDAGSMPSEDGGTGDDAGAAATTRYFAPGSFWTTDISATPASVDSDLIIDDLVAAGGWGNGNVFQIDFSLEVLSATPDVPRRAFTPTQEHYSPDCDITPVPVPVGGNLEGEDGYVCASDGDCHLIVHTPDEDRLYEMWRANISASDVFTGGCLAVWNTSAPVGDEGRGAQCTSADAAGFPIAPLLFSADEVAAGEIAHAIRFILPNNRVRALTYVPPATHGTNTSGGPNAPQYGVHFRLRADFPLDTLPNEGARVVARALQRYGMYHADGGNIALTAQSDSHTAASWSGLLGPHDLSSIAVSDFEVIDHGADVAVTYDCQRTPLIE